MRTTILWVLLITAMGTGCGRRAKPVAAAPAAALGAAGLGYVILHDDSNDSTVPGTAVEAAAGDIRRGEGALLFQKHLLWPKPTRERPRAELYLAWPGEGIVDAYFEYEVVNVVNVRESAERRREPASYDRTRKLWFVPLRRIVGKPEYASTDRWYVTHLELHDGAGGVSRTSVSFKVHGPLPEIPVTAVWIAPATDPRGIQMQFASGFVPLVETFRNETPRPLKLWFQGMRQGSIELRSRLIHHSFQGGPSGPEGFAISEVPVAYDHFATFSVEEVEANGNLLPLTGEWFEIPLPPQQSVQLRWRLSADTDGTHCSLPAPREVVFAREVRREVCQSGRPGDGPRECTTRVERREARRTESWELRQVAVSGNIWRRAYVADAQARLPDYRTILVSPLVAELPAPGGDLIRNVGGDFPFASAAPYSCGGLF